MSFILEALKKADAERERGAVPGLTTDQVNSTIYITHQGSALAWWVTGVLALVLVGVAGTWAWRARAPAPAAVEAPPLPTPTARDIPASAPTPVAVATSQARPTPKPAPAPTPAAAPAPANKAQAPAAPAPAGKPSASAGTAAVQAPPAPPSAPAAPPAPTPLRSAQGGVPAFAELPEPMRRQIPPLHITGAVVSDTSSEWTLIINDQLVSRGGQVSPELRLEEVSASSAVFNFKGQRFRLDR